MNDKWPKLRRNIRIGLLIAALVGSFVSGWFFGLTGAWITAASVLCLALGFWITENLIGVFTGLKKANPTAVGLLFLGKLGWWASLFWLSRSFPSGMEIPIALGIGAFLLALLFSTISLYGLPKISDAKGVGDP